MTSTAKKATRSLIATAALIATMTAGLTAMSMPATASAQPVPPAARMDMRANDRIDTRIARLRDDIRMGEHSRRLSLRESRRLSGKLNAIVDLKRSYERRGLNRREIDTLNAKLDVLSGQIHAQAHDGNRR